jgi:hypothetical protein
MDAAHHWSEISDKPITLDAIREMYVPSTHYHVSQNRYQPGVRFPGSIGLAGRIYVLSGACSLTVGDWRSEIYAGMFVDFPRGKSEFEVLGDAEVQLVNVWLIPERYRTKNTA